MGRETDPFYTHAPWLRIRELALKRDRYCCVWCRRAGRTARDGRGRRIPVPATLVHHIIPRSEAPEMELVLDNLVSLCARCHDEAHPEKHTAMSQKKDAVPEIAKGIAVARLREGANNGQEETAGADGRGHAARQHAIQGE